MIAESKFPGKLRVFGLQGGGIAVNRINDGLIVKPDSTIKVFRRPPGKTLGHVPGIQWRTISRHMVQAAGLDPDKESSWSIWRSPCRCPRSSAGRWMRRCRWNRWARSRWPPARLFAP